ncbi:hypothetical protein ACKFKG_20035 [Phormidesmis sp. 146-35]
MKKSKEVVIAFSICAGIAVVAAGADLMTSENTTIYLKPGFKRRTEIVHSSFTEQIQEYCSTRDNPYQHSKEPNILVLEEDFDRKSIQITVEAEGTKQFGNGSDPAIVIRSSEGRLKCKDYYDQERGTSEKLNTDERNVAFKPKAGAYRMEIWSYNQPAKTYRITIIEEDP